MIPHSRGLERSRDKSNTLYLHLPYTNYVNMFAGSRDTLSHLIVPTETHLVIY